MHIRARAYLQAIARWRNAKQPWPRRRDAAGQTTSPLLVYTAVALALLLVIVEIDLHAAELQSLGLLGYAGAIDPMLLSP